MLARVMTKLDKRKGWIVPPESASETVLVYWDGGAIGLEQISNLVWVGFTVVSPKQEAPQLEGSQ